MDLFYN
jgi:hypothetical protein